MSVNWANSHLVLKNKLNLYWYCNMKGNNICFAKRAAWGAVKCIFFTMHAISKPNTGMFWADRPNSRFPGRVYIVCQDQTKWLLYHHIHLHLTHCYGFTIGGTVHQRYLDFWMLSECGCFRNKRRHLFCYAWKLVPPSVLPSCISSG